MKREKPGTAVQPEQPDRGHGHSELKEILFDSSRKAADMAATVIGPDPEKFSHIIRLVLEDSYPYSMRAARVMFLVAERHPDLIRPYLPDLIRGLPDYQTDGVKRAIGKLLTQLWGDFDEETTGILVDSCFSWISSREEKVAQKVYAIEILYQISAVYPEIKTELISTLEFHMPEATAGLRTAGRKILKKLYRETGPDLPDE